MARAVLVAVVTGILLPGCAAEEPPGTRPGGNNGNGGTRQPDAGIDGGGDSGTPGLVRGTVCAVTDLRRPSPCPPGGRRAGLIVTEVSTTTKATTDTNGRFTLTVRARDVAMLEVTSATGVVVPSLVPVPAIGGVVDLPAPNASDHEALLRLLEPVIPDGTGTVVVYYADGDGRALPGVLVTAPDGTSNVPFYDQRGGGPTDWVREIGTGPLGVALLFGVPAGSTKIVATGPQRENLDLQDILVVDGHVTFVSRRR